MFLGFSLWSLGPPDEFSPLCGVSLWGFSMVSGSSPPYGVFYGSLWGLLYDPCMDPLYGLSLSLCGFMGPPYEVLPVGSSLWFLWGLSMDSMVLPVGLLYGGLSVGPFFAPLYGLYWFSLWLFSVELLRGHSIFPVGPLYGSLWIFPVVFSMVSMGFFLWVLSMDLSGFFGLLSMESS